MARLRSEERSTLRLYGGASVRPLRWRLDALPGGLDARRARTVAAALADLAADPCPPARVWVLDEVPGAGALPPADGEGRARLLEAVGRGR